MMKKIDVDSVWLDQDYSDTVLDKAKEREESYRREVDSVKRIKLQLLSHLMNNEVLV